MTRTLRAPSGVTSLSVAGVTYDVGPDGYIEVSKAHEQGLVDIGFIREDRPLVEAPAVKASATTEAPWTPPAKGK